MDSLLPSLQLPQACEVLTVRSSGLRRSQGHKSPGSILCLIILGSHCPHETLSGGDVHAGTSRVWFPAWEAGFWGNQPPSPPGRASPVNGLWLPEQNSEVPGPLDSGESEGGQSSQSRARRSHGGPVCKSRHSTSSCCSALSHSLNIQETHPLKPSPHMPREAVPSFPSACCRQKHSQHCRGARGDHTGPPSHTGWPPSCCSGCSIPADPALSALPPPSSLGHPASSF